MSYQDGWSAINLEMPRRVPRTEYSAGGHWDLIRRVTGIDVSHTSPPEVRQEASRAFMKAWNYDFCWNTLISGGEFKEKHTSMGHAVYAAGGADFRQDVKSLFSEPEDALKFDPWQAFGTIDKAATTKRFEEHYRNSLAGFPDAVAMTGVYITCVSGLIDLLGWDILLLAAGTDPKAFGELTNRYAAWMQQYFDALGAADVPVVMVHDDIVWTEGPFIAPAWYRRYVFPHYRRYFQPLLATGKKIMFTSDGNYTEFLDDVVAAGAHGLAMEPTTDMARFAAKYGRTHVFIGNADTRILLFGTRPQIRAEVERCMAIGKNCPGFFMAVGNHIPANTPVENAIYYNEVYEELSKRR
jgi:hypothetical protein